MAGTQGTEQNRGDTSDVPASELEAPAGGAASPSGDGPGGGVDGGGLDSLPAASPPARSPDSGEDPWYNKRIRVLTAQLHDERRKNAALVGRPQEQPAAPAPPGPTAQSEADIEARIEERAAAREFNRKCDTTAEAGATVYPDFMQKVQNIQRLVDASNPAEATRFNQMLEAAIDTGQGVELIYALGKDMDATGRILAMSPVRMGMEMARRAAEVAPPASPGGGGAVALPNPLRPVGNHTPSHTQIDPSDSRSDEVNIDTWMARRNKQVQERAPTLRGLR